MDLSAATEHRHLLDPATLAKVEGLDLRTRFLVEGMMSGRHRSPFRGFSVEFVEHRRYSQGDDLKHLDWKVFGRSDKYYVKQYQQESNLQLMIVLDASESMAYRSDARGLSKHEYAGIVAAGIAYLVLQQGDAVGLARFDENAHRVYKATNHPAQFNTIIHELEQPPVGKKTCIRPVLDALAEQLTRRHMVVILSDLFDDPDDILRGIRHLRHCRHEPMVLHILDHAELEFPFTQWTRFKGLEGFDPLLTEPRMVRERYLAEVRRFQEKVRQGCHELKADYTVFDTSLAIDQALSDYLATRAHRNEG